MTRAALCFLRRCGGANADGVAGWFFAHLIGAKGGYQLVAGKGLTALA